jgi:Double sensory domain of two-component sensor kinase
MRVSIRVKLVFALLAGIVGIAAACAALMLFVYDRAIRAAGEEEIHHAAGAFRHLEASEVRKLGAALEAVGVNEELQRAFAARDRARLLELAEPLFRTLGERYQVTHWDFIAPDRSCFLRVHAPELYGDFIQRSTLLQAASSRSMVSGKELGKTAFALRAVTPWVVGGRLLGYLEMAEEIDHFLGAIHEQTGDEYGLFVAKSRLDRNDWAAVHHGRMQEWDEHPDLVLVSATALMTAEPDLGPRLKSLPAAGVPLPESASDSRIIRGVFPVRDASADAVGAVIIRHDLSPLYAGVAALRLQVIALVVLMAAGLAGLVVFMLDALVFDRLKRMARVLEDLPARMQSGELQLGAAAHPGREDEIGRFERLFDRALEAVWRAGLELRRARRDPPGDKEGR